MRSDYLFSRWQRPFDIKYFFFPFVSKFRSRKGNQPIFQQFHFNCCVFFPLYRLVGHRAHFIFAATQIFLTWIGGLHSFSLKNSFHPFFLNESSLCFVHSINSIHQNKLSISQIHKFRAKKRKQNTIWKKWNHLSIITYYLSMEIELLKLLFLLDRFNQNM